MSEAGRQTTPIASPTERSPAPVPPVSAALRGCPAVAPPKVHAIVLSDTIRYRRETREATTLTVETTLSAARRDASRWEFSQQVLNGDEVAATVVALGGWLSTTTHKLAVPPAAVGEKLLASPRSEDFRWLD